MIGTDISHASNLLQKGKVVAIPTETVYGLAANAFSSDAVLKIFSIKKRPLFNPLIVHTDSIEKINQFVEEIPKPLKNILHHFWPGPITVLLKKKIQIPDLVTGGSSYVAVRIPKHEMTLSLLKSLPFPIAAPSANLFGRISPTSALHVSAQLRNRIEYILDGGLCEIGIESTIIFLNETSKVEVLRTGGVSIEALTSMLGYEPMYKKTSQSIIAPGMLKSHYAPKIPLYIGEIKTMIENNIGMKICVISFSEIFAHPQIIKQIILSKNKDLHEAAKKLFGAMHEAEDSNADIILSEIFPNVGLGIAINDRLKRASIK